MSVKRFASVVVIFAVLFVAAPVMAASAWYQCSIERVIVQLPSTSYPDGAYFFYLSEINGLFTNIPFGVVDTTMRDSVLSVFLTAVATDRDVAINGDPDNSVITQRLNNVQIVPCEFKSAPCQ